HTVSYLSVDVAGNSEIPRTLTVRIDEKAPLTTASVTAVNAAGWNNGVASITLSAADPTLADGQGGSGVASTTYMVDGGSQQSYTGAFTISSEGIHTVSYFSIDAAGNRESVHFLTVRIDRTAPVVSLSAAPAYTNSTTPTFSGIAGTIVASDGSSADASTVTVAIYSGSSATGIPVRTITATVGAGGNYQVTLPAGQALAEGTYTAQATQTDVAGNPGTSAATTFTVDTTAPVVGLNAAPVYTNSTTPAFS